MTNERIPEPPQIQIIVVPIWNQPLKYETKPYQGTIGPGNMKYKVDKSGVKLPDYKSNIDPKNVKTQPKEYKQTIDPRPKRAANRPPPPPPKPKQKIPKPAPAPKRTVNPAVKQTKMYEPNIKWDKQPVKMYEPKLYQGNVKHDAGQTKLYELPENYYEHPKGKKKPQQPVKRMTPEPKPVEKKLKSNKVEPLHRSPPPVVQDPLKSATPPQPKRVMTPPPPPPQPKRVMTPPPPPIVVPYSPEPRTKPKAPDVQEPKSFQPVYVYYDPPSPEPLPPARRSYYPKPEPFYNSRPEPVFPPLIPISMSDYLSSGEPKAKPTNKKERGNPLIPVMYPPSKMYDLSRYSPPPQYWDDPYQIISSVSFSASHTTEQSVNP
ncbi:hypothetical protein Btru_009958 [Bulinus truncatus]|nr:hypothetical protein Btru_009958 [Bulinus truncatus]